MNNIDLPATVHNSAGKPWILQFMWMPVDTNSHPNTLADQTHSPRHWHTVVPEQDIGQEQSEQGNHVST